MYKNRYEFKGFQWNWNHLEENHLFEAEEAEERLTASPRDYISRFVGDEELLKSAIQRACESTVGTYKFQKQLDDNRDRIVIPMPMPKGVEGVCYFKHPCDPNRVGGHVRQSKIRVLLLKEYRGKDIILHFQSAYPVFATGEDVEMYVQMNDLENEERGLL